MPEWMIIVTAFCTGWTCACLFLKFVAGWHPILTRQQARRMHKAKNHDYI